MRAVGGGHAEAFMSHDLRTSVPKVVPTRMLVETCAREVAFENATRDSGARAAPPSEQVVASCAKYESKDVDGRVWGMPSAFGRGQCLDCPNKAAPPSVLCKACQLAASWAMPMPAEELLSIQSALNDLLAATTGKDRETIAPRLQELYDKLHAGSITQAVQAKVMSLAASVSAGDKDNAKKCMADISAQHWD